MGLQENIDTMMVACLSNKENIVNAIVKTKQAVEACDDLMVKEGEIDKFKRFLTVKRSCSELIDELMDLAGEYSKILDSAMVIKRAWDGYVFNDEQSYFSKYGKEVTKRERAEKRLSALKEMYGSEEIRNKLIEYQKSHDVKL